MLPTKQVDTNYGYDGNYKETNCLEEYGVFKSKSQDSDIKEEKPDAVKCAYEKYKFDSGDDEMNRMRKSAHKGIIGDYCENSTTACNIEDESGNPVEPDEMCMDVNVCDQGMTIFEIIPLSLEFFKIFQILLDGISPDKAMELMAAKKSRVTDFKKQQAQIKIMEIEMIKQKYNEVIASEKEKYKGDCEKKPEPPGLNPNNANSDNNVEDKEKDEKGTGVAGGPEDAGGEGAGKGTVAGGPDDAGKGTAAGKGPGAGGPGGPGAGDPGNKGLQLNVQTVGNIEIAEGGNGTSAAGGGNEQANDIGGNTGLQQGKNGTKVVCVPKKDSAEARESCAKHVSEDACNNDKDTKCMVKEENPIMDDPCKKYDFETALESYKEYQIFKQCVKNDKIEKIIKEYEDLMTKDLSQDEPETYKDKTQLLNILQEHEKLNAQVDELQTTGTLSKLTKGVKKVGSKAWEFDKIQTKCNSIALKNTLGTMIKGVSNVVTSPINKLAKIADTKKNNTAAPAAGGARSKRKCGCSRGSKRTRKIKNKNKNKM
jgi:hypothetical protein